MEHVQYDFSSERALLGEESGLPQPSPTGVERVLKNDDDDDDDNPARLMVAAACACAEQAERNRGATTHVTPFFSPTLLTDRGRYGTHVTGTMDRGVVSESAALGRALASSQQKMFAPAALGARKPKQPKREDEEKKEPECIICFATLDADDIAAAAARACGCKQPMHLLCLQAWKDMPHYNGLCMVCGIAID